jgi:nitrite reductase/ring-hydroxylating ferredoxin subunit
MFFIPISFTAVWLNFISMKRACFFLCAASMLLFTACRREQQVVPNVAVNVLLYLNDPQNTAITTIGGWIYVNGGYRGIVLHRKSQNEFVAFDRTCPFRPEESASQVSVDSSNVILEDRSCGSKFLLSDGSAIQTPALVPLKQYNTTFDGNSIRIYN